MYGGKPEGAVAYARSNDTGRDMELIVWSAPPPGDALCRLLTGQREADLVREILDGKFDAFFPSRRRDAQTVGGVKADDLTETGGEDDA